MNVSQPTEGTRNKEKKDFGRCIENKVLIAVIPRISYEYYIFGQYNGQTSYKPGKREGKEAMFSQAQIS